MTNKTVSVLGDRPCYQCTANARGIAVMIGCPALFFVAAIVANIANVINHQPWFWEPCIFVIPVGLFIGMMFGALVSLPDIDEIKNGELCQTHYDEVFKRG